MYDAYHICILAIQCIVVHVSTPRSASDNIPTRLVRRSFYVLSWRCVGCVMCKGLNRYHKGIGSV